MAVALERVPHTDLHAIPEAVARLRASFASGRTRPLAWRRAQLEALAAMMKENADAFLEALAADFGKPALEAYATDVGIVATDADAARKSLAKWTRPEKVATPMQLQPGKSRIVREPLGVVLIISPFNYPVQLLLCPLVGAIAAGNCAVLKPSEMTPHTSAVLAELVPKYLDPEAVHLVEGGVDETTTLLEERFDHIFYTGNGTVGRIVMQAAAKHLTPVTLELGGKSPCIVAEDADLEVTARRIAWGKFLNAGQTCVAPDYVLVHPRKEQALIEAIRRSVEEFYGSEPRKSADYARVVNERHHRRLAAMLEGVAPEDIVLGGELEEGECYIAPTVVRGVTADSPLMQEEIFGPILPILTCESIDEAIAFVNEREKPLALYVFTSSSQTEEAVVAGTSSGGVCVNGILWHLANPGLPFGGVGESGMGAYHGRTSFETFSHRKSVLSKSTRVDMKMLYPPYADWKTKLVRKFM